MPTRSRKRPFDGGGGEEAVIPVRSTLKYLGLFLDSRWTFQDHFRLLLPKARRMAAAIGKVANIGGPEEGKHRVYASIVMSAVYVIW